MKWITLAAMGLVLAGCGQQPATTDKVTDVKAAPEPAKVETPVKPATAVTLASGTAIKIRTDSTISTKSAQTGDTFTAILAEPLKVDGQIVAPRGAAVTGLVAEADDGGRVKGVASLSLRLSKITIDGKAVPVDTGVFVKNAPATKKKDAIKVGIGAGAAVGAATGGAAGTGVVLATHGDPAVVAAESLITFKLTTPVDVK
jgi:hypothetical protein